MPSAPDCANSPSRPCGGSVGASEALSRTSGSLLMSPKELGPTTRIPEPRARRTSSAWSRAPSLPSSANPDDTTRSDFTPASAHSSTTSSTAWAGTATTARSTGSGHVAHRRVGPASPQRAHVGVDRVDPPGEAGVDEPVEQLAADRVLAPARADDRDGARVEHAAHAERLGAVLARHRDGLGLVGGLDVEADLDDAVLDVPGDVVAGVGEDREHLAVLREHLRGEAADAHLARDRGEVLEEHRPDALALVEVADVEGDLGAARVDPVVAPDPDDLLAHRHDERDPVDVVDVGEPVHVGVAEPAQRREEAQVDRLLGLRRVEAVDAGGVGGPDRPDVGDGAVAQDDVGLPPRGVPRRQRLVLHGAHRATPPVAPEGGHTVPMELREAVRRRRMVRRFDPDVPVPREVVRDLVALAVRAPSAGFSQGWDFVALLDAPDRAAFWDGHGCRRATGRLAARRLGRPGPRRLPVRPRRLPRPLRRARQGLDRPLP